VKWLRPLGWLWVIPVAIPIWLFYLLPLWGLGFIRFDCSAPWRAIVFRAVSSPQWWVHLWSGWGGHALPFAIVLRWFTSDETVRHELRHTDQWLWLGPLFPPVYGVLRLFCGYIDNPLERDARAHEQ